VKYCTDDEVVKGCHSRENGNPENVKVSKKTGFLLPQERQKLGPLNFLQDRHWSLNVFSRIMPACRKQGR
jgi:hypothetical protein